MDIGKLRMLQAYAKTASKAVGNFVGFNAEQEENETTKLVADILIDVERQLKAIQDILQEAK